MTWTFALAALQQLPAIIAVVEQLIPGTRKSADKKAAATSEMTKYEGPLALDQRVQAAKSALIDAQVEYLNAMAAAEATAVNLGIPVVPFVQPTSQPEHVTPAPVASAGAVAVTAVAAVGGPAT